MKLHILNYMKTRKLYVRRNNNKVDLIEIGRIVIVHLLRRVHVHHAFLINDDKILSLLLNL